MASDLAIRTRAGSAGSVGSDSSWTVLRRTPSPSEDSFASSDTFDGETIGGDIDDATGETDGSNAGEVNGIDSIDGNTLHEEPIGTLPIWSTLGDKPRRGSFTSEIVALSVGHDSEAQVFKVHKDVICFYSSVFKTLLDRATSIDGTITPSFLGSESAYAFEIFVHWMYTRDVPEGSAHDTSSSTGELCTRVLCMLWVFGDKYGIPHLQNDMVIKIMKRVMHSAWKDPSWHTTYIYRHSPNSPLRHLIMDLVAATIGYAATKNRYLRWTTGVRLDLANAVKEISHKQPKDLAQWDLCHYLV